MFSEVFVRRRRDELGCIGRLGERAGHAGYDTLVISFTLC